MLYRKVCVEFTILWKPLLPAPLLIILLSCEDLASVLRLLFWQDPYYAPLNKQGGGPWEMSPGTVFARMRICVDGGLWEVLNHRHTAVEASDGSLIFCVEHMRTHTRAQLHGCKNILPCDTFCQIMHKVGHFCSTNLHWLMTNLCLSLSLTHFNTLTQAEQPENSAFKKQMDQ